MPELQFTLKETKQEQRKSTKKHDDYEFTGIRKETRF